MSTQEELDRQLQFAQEREAEAHQKQVVYEWLAKKLSEPAERRYTCCQANAQLLADHIREIFDDEWSVENLDRAYDHLSSQGQLIHDVKLQQSTAPAKTNTHKITIQPATVDDGLPPVPPGCKWPKTKAEIRSMCPADYRSAYHGKNGQQFRNYINAILSRGV